MKSATSNNIPLITRRNFLGQAAALGALCACSRPIKPAQPDVVLVVIDTLRADKLNAERNYVPLMPNLNALAENAVHFTEAYSQETFTKPSVASILSSLHPEVHGVNFGIWTPAQLGKVTGLNREVQVDVFSHQLPSLPAMMKQAGYTTIGLQTNMQLHPESGFDYGFDNYYYLGDVPADIVTSQAVAALESTNNPVFLYVHYMDPHLPYSPPKDVIAAFGKVPDISTEDVELLKNYSGYYTDLIAFGFGLSSERKTKPLSEKGRDFVRFMYDGDVRFIDREIKTLLDAVKKRNPESLTVITADHGEEFWEHGSVGHTKTAYRELAHVPLIFSAGALSAQKIAAPARNIDILPTIAAFLGISPPEGCQGTSLLPLFSGENPGNTMPVYTSASGVQTWDKIHWQAIYADGYRLVVNISANTTELFNIADDPREQNSIADKEPERTGELKAILETINEANANHPLRQKTITKVQLNDEDLETLRSLGYIR